MSSDIINALEKASCKQDCNVTQSCLCSVAAVAIQELRATITKQAEEIARWKAERNATKAALTTARRDALEEAARLCDVLNKELQRCSSVCEIAASKIRQLKGKTCRMIS